MILLYGSKWFEPLTFVPYGLGSKLKCQRAMELGYLHAVFSVEKVGFDPLGGVRGGEEDPGRSAAEPRAFAAGNGRR